MMRRPGFRGADLVTRFELNERIDLRWINFADQWPPRVNSAAQIRQQIRTGSVDACGKDRHDTDRHGTAHGSKGAPPSMSGFLIVRGKFHRPRRRFADDLNRMPAAKPIDRFDGREGNLEMAAAISTLGAAEMRVSGHTGHRVTQGRAGSLAARLFAI